MVDPRPMARLSLPVLIFPWLGMAFLLAHAISTPSGNGRTASDRENCSRSPRSGLLARDLQITTRDKLTVTDADRPASLLSRD